MIGQSSRFVSSLSLALAATLLLVLTLLSAGSASAGQYCQNLKGELCITLTPDPATNLVGTDHTVTAAATVDGDPLGAVFDVGFAVYSGPNAGETSVTSLGDDGTADFTYTGDGGAGTDNIVAVFCDVTADCQGFVDACAQDGSNCLSNIQANCGQNQLQREARVVPAGIINFCFGPATAVKNWQEPTPTPSPSPTPVDVGAGGQEPSATPTPAGLPDTGGAPGESSSTPWVVLALAFAAAGAGGLAVARKRATTR